MKLRTVVAFLFVTSILAQPQSQSSSSFSGSWKAQFADSVSSGSLNLTFLQKPDGTLEGTFTSSEGGRGIVAGKVQADTLEVVLTNTSQGCEGSFTGKLGIGSKTGTYSGHDCRGWHENGVMSLSKLEGGAPQDSNSGGTMQPAEGPAPKLASKTNPGLPSGQVLAVAYRVVPQSNTTYLHTNGRSSTSCYGSGSDIGSFTTLNMDCETTSTPAYDTPVTWQYADVYNVVETNTTRYVIGCRASWRWSKCTFLIPGTRFDYEIKGGKMEIRGSKDGKKEMTLKFNILGTEGR